jgi:single-strand DNA-binding protein
MPTEKTTDKPKRAWRDPINVTSIMGRLTRDVAIRTVGSGENATSVANFSIAHQDGRGTTEHTSFFDCESWGGTALGLQKATAKGDCIVVTARLRQDSWEDKDSHDRRTKIVLVVESFVVAKKAQGAAGGGASATEQAPPF